MKLDSSNEQYYRQFKLSNGEEILAEVMQWSDEEQACIIVRKAMSTLRGRARVKRAMWSRRAQEYEQKINSGDLISIAEVIRDLHRNDEQREQSYSERQLYEAALERLTREVAAVDGVEEEKAQVKVGAVLDGKAA